MILAHYDHFLFDLDGTLIDSFGDIKYFLERSYKEVLNQDILIMRNHIGPPLPDMIEEITPGLKGSMKEAVIREFRRNYDNSSYDLTFQMRGAIELLEELKTHNKDLYLVTNKSDKPTNRIIKKLKLNFFKDVLTPDKIEGKKKSKSELIRFLMQHYNLIPSKTVMIGDTALDTIAAKDNSIDSISIAEGYDTTENLKRANPTYIINTLTELQISTY